MKNNFLSVKETKKCQAQEKTQTLPKTEDCLKNVAETIT